MQLEAGAVAARKGSKDRELNFSQRLCHLLMKNDLMNEEVEERSRCLCFISRITKSTGSSRETFCRKFLVNRNYSRNFGNIFRIWNKFLTQGSNKQLWPAWNHHRSQQPAQPRHSQISQLFKADYCLRRRKFVSLFGSLTRSILSYLRIADASQRQRMFCSLAEIIKEWGKQAAEKPDKQ